MPITVIAKCILHSFVVSIYLGKLVVVQVTFTESTSIVSIFSGPTPVKTYSGKLSCRPVS